LKKQEIKIRPPRPNAKPELLAPAGSLAAWAAAVEAGADAVYLGLKEFSARAFAANFSLGDLTRLVPLSHDQGVKVFVAFNALVKEKELPRAAKLLDALTRIQPDALIIQDLGLLRLIKKHFPGFEVHASTLTAVHNPAGLKTLAGLGFERAVLARELSLKEIENLAQNPPLGLEVFIHGAMCFSISGLCLMSSFLGGKGSLRGACTQPCRRRYVCGRKRGYFFSPTDLDASRLMGRIRTLPLAALKIEGRMKGPDYVARVVKAYRLLLDAPAEDMEAALAEAETLLADSLSRHRSTGFFLSAQPATGLAPHQAATSGLFLGQVKESGPTGAAVVLRAAVQTGDRLRVQFKNNDERQAFTLKELLVDERPAGRAEAGDRVGLSAPFLLSQGDLIFKVQASGSEDEALSSSLVEAFQARPPSQLKPSPRLKRVLDELKPSRSRPARTGGRPELWYRLARVESLPGLEPLRPDRIVLPLSSANLRRLSNLKSKIGELYSRIIWAAPPVLFDSSDQAFRRDLAQAIKMGAAEFMVSNLGHLPLISSARPGSRRRFKVFADYRFNCLNSQTEAQLADLGLAGVTLSIESDEENLSRMLEHPGPIPRLLYLFGRPPLFTARFRPAELKENVPAESPRGERFRWRTESGLTLVFAEQPVFLAPLLKFTAPAGVKAMIVDLEFDPRPLVTARLVHEAVKSGRPIKSASKFNLKRGLF